jgi:tRNA threonylcarbamoyladenosine modification (KEOPS) complex  Pcc1 subunit
MQTPGFNIHLTIEIGCQKDKESKAIYNSLIPDNIDLPDNLKIGMEVQERLLLLKIMFNPNISKENDINTLISTIDEIMEHIEIIKNVIEND